MDQTPAQRDDRFLLWVDAVGGYWVCMGDEVTLGQPGPVAKADIPILADLSAHHARIRRDGEGYLVEAFREVSVDDRRVDHLASLKEGCKLQFGPALKMVFRRPHALSATARLDLVSHHHTHPTVDAILLMADSLVLGPRPHCHVLCPDWPSEVILYRQEGQLYIRAPGTFEVDRVSCHDRQPVRINSHIVGPYFSLSLEPL